MFILAALTIAGIDCLQGKSCFGPLMSHAFVLRWTLWLVGRGQHFEVVNTKSWRIRLIMGATIKTNGATYHKPLDCFY
jgi:hypothetical protein